MMIFIEAPSNIVIQGYSTLFESNIASIKNAGPEDSLMSSGGSVTSKAKR
jgi:hypothetical protein